MTSDPPYLSIPEAARRLGYSRSRLHQLAAAGQIPGAIRIGRMWLIPRGYRVPPVTRGRWKNKPR